MTYKIEDLKTAKRIISEAMSIVQSLADQLNQKRLKSGLSTPEKEMLAGLNTAYENSADTLEYIEAVENDLPPWDEE